MSFYNYLLLWEQVEKDAAPVLEHNFGHIDLGNTGQRKRSDKHTQSPIIKVFKDMIQRDNTDPEKANLLKEKQRDKKRKLYSETRTKSDQRSYDSSSTDKYRTNKHNKITVQDIKEERNEAYGYDRTHSEPFQGEKRESWWFWGDNDKKKPTDTCSCVSCALKKVIGSECTCIACLLLLFSVSVVVVFLLVFRTMPSVMETTENLYENNPEKKLQMIKEKRQLSYENGLGDFTERQSWADSLNSRLKKFSSSFLSPGYNNIGYQAPNVLDDFDSGLSEDLSNVLDTEKMMDSQNSERLRDFFKKLIQTDTQIRKLKQIIKNNYKNDDMKSITDRFKRSLKRKSEIHTEHPYKYKELDNSQNNDKNKRSKKNNDSEIARYVIEEEKLFIRYEPDKKRNFPKCSHDTKANSQDKQLKHPYYKNSHRLDQMLNEYKKPTTSSQDVKQNTASKHLDLKTEVKHEDKNNNIEVFGSRNLNEEQPVKYETDQIRISTKSVDDQDYDYDINKILSTTSAYDIALSVSTFINPIDRTVGNILQSSHAHPGHRKLLQVDEEEEVEYQDVKEVLADDLDSQDDVEGKGERKKRDDQQSDLSQILNPNKYNPPRIYNPNWKGPMPLYPDELNSMIKQAALQNLDIQIPVNTKDSKSESDKAEKDISDTQYLEDYMDTKYDKMVKMAQAYSDYGVIYGKKDGTSSDKYKDHKSANKLKMLWDRGFNSQGIIGRLRKGSAAYGGQLDDKQGKSSSNHDDIMKVIQKHVKISNVPIDEKHTSPQEINTELGKIYTPTTVINLPLSTAKRTPDSHLVKDFFSNIRKGSRSLKSIESSDINNKKTDTMLNIKTYSAENKDNSTMLSFLSLMADWFKNMAVLAGEITTETSITTTYSENRNASFGLNSSKNKSKILPLNENTNGILYPSYDADMVDNIGHRSRVLMSFDNSNTSIEHLLDRNESSVIVTEKGSKVSFATPETVEEIIPVVLAMATENNTNNLNDEEIDKNNDIIKDDKNALNKTIVKRSIDDSSLVFWNDLYDDNEYGVKVDYLDNVVRDKHSAKSSKSSARKTKDWIKGKVHNIAHKFHRKSKKKKVKHVKSKTTRTNDCTEEVPHAEIKHNKNPKKRQVKNVEFDVGTDMKGIFQTLTANMKKVCREAAKAVQNSRNIEVRESSKEDSAAASLMQQLVRLMTDVVDIQVQQKTCAKLPPDLRNFLEWLTAPAETNPRVDNLGSGYADFVQGINDGGRSRFEKSTQSLDFLTPLTEDTHQDDRTECLGTIRAVQDLIQQYEGMTDEDKSKMTGVKEYLENQLDFLNKKLNNYDDVNLYKMYEKREIRLKRDSEKSTSPAQKTGHKHRHRVNKLMRLFKRKRNKSTTSGITKISRSTKMVDKVAKKQEGKLSSKVVEVKSTKQLKS